MSKYKRIETEFTSAESLIAALEDVGFAGRVERARNIRVPDLALYGYQGDKRAETASIRIPREYVGGASNDLGFAWNGKGFEAIISEFDQSNRGYNEAWVGKLKQRYAYHEISRQAKARGYKVLEKQSADGTVRLTLAKVG